MSKAARNIGEDTWKYKVEKIVSGEEGLWCVIININDRMPNF
jgi:hypothetical protein